MCCSHSELALYIYFEKSHSTIWRGKNLWKNLLWSFVKSSVWYTATHFSIKTRYKATPSVVFGYVCFVPWHPKKKIKCLDTFFVVVVCRLNADVICLQTKSFKFFLHYSILNVTLEMWLLRQNLNNINYNCLLENSTQKSYKGSSNIKR